MSGVPDYPLEETIDFKFTSRAFATGIPTTLAGTPTCEVFEDNSTTEVQTGLSPTVDFDSVTGLNNIRISATAANGYEAGKSYAVVIEAGTVGGVSVVGEVVAQFSIQRSPVNWANVTAPTTAVDLSATDIQLVDTITTYTGNTVQTGDNFAQIGTAGAGLTDLGGMSTAMKAEVNAEADTALTDYDPPTNTEMVAAFTEIKGATWASGTDTLEHIRDKQTDIETDTAEIGAAGAGLTAIPVTVDWANGGRLDLILDTIAQDTTTDIPALLPAALVSGRMDSNASAIADDATAATNLAASALGIVPGACEGTPSTTVIQTDLTEATDDHYIGRIVVFTSGAAAGQASDITDYTGSTGTITVTALTTAPAAADTFVIV